MKRTIQIVAAVAAVTLSGVTQADVLLRLPNLPVANGTASNPVAYAFGLSADGNTVVGTAATVLSGKKPLDAVEWVYNSAAQTAPITDIGSLNPVRVNSPDAKAGAFSVTRDGSVIAGISTSSSSSTQYDFLSVGPASSSNLVNLNLADFQGVRVSEDGKTLIEGFYDNSTGINGILYNKFDGNGFVKLPAPSSLNVTGIAPGFQVTTPASSSPGGVSNATASTSGPVFTGIFGLFNPSTNAQAQQNFRYTATGGYTAVGTSCNVINPTAVSPVTNVLAPYYITPISADGNFMAGLGTNPSTGKLDAYEYDALDNSTTWFNTIHASAVNFTPTGITDDGSYVVGRDYNNGTQDGWIWSAGTGFETIGTFLSSDGLSLPSGALPGDVYGAALNGNTLSLTGLIAGGSNTQGGSFYAQVSVPEPASLSLLLGGITLCLSRRVRRS